MVKIESIWNQVTKPDIGINPGIYDEESCFALVYALFND